MTRFSIPAVTQRIIVLVTTFLSSFVFSTSAHSNIPGGSGGSFTVTDAGAASYTIPIVVPPGTNGIEPELSITYNSSMGNGILGVGWALGGISQISRCPKTIETDGGVGGVNHDPNDRFCLDGQRLVAISGAYGANGTEYRTEIDSFAKIKSFGSTININGGTAPAYFQVWQKDGEIWYYGFNLSGNNARIAVPGTGSIHKWMLSRVQDRWGNYYDIIFDDVTSEQCLPSRIEYTKNNGRGLASDRSVKFIYQTTNRPDPIPQAVAGGEFKNTRLLDRIETSVSNSVVREYRFTYQTSSASGRSRLRSVRECGSAGNCLPQTTFNYRTETAGFTQHNNSVDLPTVMVNHDKNLIPDSIESNFSHVDYGQFTDFNGDGKHDFIMSWRGFGASDYSKVWLSNGAGWTRNYNYVPPVGEFLLSYRHVDDPDPNRRALLHTGHLVDVNGDGKVDWVKAYRDRDGVDHFGVWLNVGVGAQAGWQLAPYVLPTPIHNHDKGYIANNIDASLNHIETGQFFDFNGDGRMDYIKAWRGMYNEGDYKQVYINNGFGWTPNSTYNLPSGEVITNYRDADHSTHPVVYTTGQLIDVNGDGLPDWVKAYRDIAGVNHNKTWINTGSGWQHDPYYALPDVIMNYQDMDNADPDKRVPLVHGQFVDVNGDGLVDYVRALRDIAGNNWKGTYINTGKGWQWNSAYKLPDVIMNYEDLDHSNANRRHPRQHGEFADLNSDGLPDFVRALRHPNGIDYKTTYRNTGSGWAADGGYQLPDVINEYSWITSGVRRGQFVDMNGDGAADWVRAYRQPNGTDQKITWTGKSIIPDHLVQITDPLGVDTHITYKPLTDSTVYTKDHNGSYPNIDLQPAAYVVSNHTTSNGVGLPTQFDYRYGGLKLNVRGRGGLGFRWRKIHHVDPLLNGLITYTEHKQTFPGIGLTEYSELRLAAGTLVRTVDPTYSAIPKNIILGPQFYAPPAVVHSEEQHYEPNMGGQLVKTTITDTTYDEYGNPVTNTVDQGDGYVTVTHVPTYRNDTTNWFLGLPERIEVTHQHPTEPSQTRVTEMTYGQWTGVLLTTVVEPDSNPDVSLTTTYGYDGYGNQTSTQIAGPDITTRTSTVQYDSNGRFPQLITNAAGHTETRDYDEHCGGMISHQGPNLLTPTTWEYDEFCRLKNETRPDGTVTTTTYQVGSAPYSTTVTTTGLPPVTQYMDILARPTLIESTGFDGRVVKQSTIYDAKGRVSQTSLPYFDGETVYWTTNTYDIIGRTTAVTLDDGTKTTIDYQGLTTVEYNDLQQSKTTKVNVRGEVIEVRDNDNEPMTYQYDAVGNLLRTIDPMGNTIAMEYDIRGRKKSMDDPDMGYWTYDYDALGQLTSQTDAKGNDIDTQYDKLGRMTQRTTVEGASTWTYDTSLVNGIGKLHTASGPDYSRTHTYDHLGRPSQTDYVIKGLSATLSTTYDNIGRPDTVTYPQGFTVKSVYNTLGYFAELQDITSGIPESLWQADAIDASGRLLQETFGNQLSTVHDYDPIQGFLKTRNTGNGAVQDLEYQWDSIGRLENRYDHRQGLTETFGYDTLNRLTLSDVTGGDTKIAGYDSIGNITFKSDVGIEYKYGEFGAGPHAVTTVESYVPPLFPNPPFSPAGIYAYDANGNMTSSPSGTVAWTSFNKPSSITRNGNTQTFQYGPELQRIYKEGGGDNTRYVGKTYERKWKDGGEIHKYYIGAGSATVEVTKQGSTFTNQYLHTDHLGSPDTITDDNGNVIERMSFDPWGQRREVDWTFAPILPTSNTTRGFTGHEMDDEVGLINMNARIYEPVLGRFLSPDPTIPDPSNLQAYNRYSYVYNNPLALTDPSGFEPNDPKWDKSAVQKVRSSSSRRVFLGYFGRNSQNARYADPAKIGPHPIKQNEYQYLGAAADILGIKTDKQGPKTFKTDTGGTVTVTPDYQGPVFSQAQREYLYGIATGKVEAPEGVSAEELAAAIELINQAYGWSREYIKYKRAKSRGTYRQVVAMVAAVAGGATGAVNFFLGNATSGIAQAEGLGSTATAILGLAMGSATSGSLPTLGDVGMAGLDVVAPELALAIGVQQHFQAIANQSVIIFHSPIPEENLPPGLDFPANARLGKWIGWPVLFKARRGGSFDFRSQYSDSSLTRQQLTDLANYNFGLVGAATGLDLSTLRNIGDWKQGLDGKSLRGQRKYQDNPRDALLINHGWYDYVTGDF